MPKTKTPRKPRNVPHVNYNPIFPGGRPQDRKDNQGARVALGDKKVLEMIAKDYERTYGNQNKKK